MKNLANSSNYKNARINTGASQQIPVGGYVCDVQAVKYIDNSAKNISDVIELAIDVAEGEYAKFFRKRFDADKDNEDRKWKGILRLWVPMDDGTEKDGWTMNIFKTAMHDFEESNPGYSWNWDENTLKGKKIGVLFGMTHSKVNGNEISYSEARYTATIQAVKDGNFKIPKEKFRNGASGNASKSNANSDNQWMQVDESGEEEIPW